VNNCIEDWRIAMTGQMLAQIIAELTVCAVHPPPGTFYFSAAVVHLGFYDFMSLLVKFSSYHLHICFFNVLQAMFVFMLVCFMLCIFCMF